MIRPSRFSLLLGLFLTLAGFTCSTSTGLDYQPDGLRSQIEWHRARWESRRFDDYAFQLKRICYCPPEYVGPVRVEVRTGQVARIVDPVTGERVDERLWHVFPTIDGLFTILLDAVDRRADRIEVEWAPSLGYPAEIRIDYRLEIADEEIGYEVRDVDALD